MRLHPWAGTVWVLLELKFPELCGLGVEIEVRSELRDWETRQGSVERKEEARV